MKDKEPVSKTVSQPEGVASTKALRKEKRCLSKVFKDRGCVEGREIFKNQIIDSVAGVGQKLGFILNCRKVNIHLSNSKSDRHR